VWEDIKKWILYLYLVTGLILGIGISAEAGLKGVEHILCVAICILKSSIEDSD